MDAAARALGVTVDAIRKRVQRGTIPHERDGSGRVWVLLKASSTMQGTSSTVLDNDQDSTGRELLEAKDETIADLRDRVAFLERQMEEVNEANCELRRTILVLTSRIPAIEPPEPRDAPETATETSEGASPAPVR